MLNEGRPPWRAKDRGAARQQANAPDEGMRATVLLYSARADTAVILKVVVIVAMWIGTALVSDKMEINPFVAASMVLFGGISFFLGPYATGSGFFVRGGFYVSAATPDWIWRVVGIILWVAAGITMLYMWEHQGA